MGLGLRPGAKAPDQPPMPYRLRASPRLYPRVEPLVHRPRRSRAPTARSRHPIADIGGELPAQGRTASPRTARARRCPTSPTAGTLRLRRETRRRVRPLAETPIAIQCGSPRACRNMFRDHLERAVQSPGVSQIDGRLSRRFDDPPSGDLVLVCQLHEFMDPGAARKHDRRAALDRPPHHEGREARRIGWKPFPVIPDEGGTVHLLGAIEHSKARGGVQNPFVR